MHIGKRHKSLIDGVDVMSFCSDRSFPRHTHEEFSIGVMTERGHDCWCCRGLVEVGAGDVIGINPGEVHDGLGRKDAPRAWHMITISQNAMAKLIDGRPEDAEFSAPVFQEAKVSELVLTSVSVAMQPDAHAEELEQRLRLICAEVLRPCDTSDDVTGSVPCVDPILEKIHSEWAEPLSLDDLASAAGLSKFRAVRAFSQRVGTTPYAYLVQHRINRARDMMMDGVRPSEAAIATGFTDQSHLTRVFNRQLGLPPQRYLAAS